MLNFIQAKDARALRPNTEKDLFESCLTYLAVLIHTKAKSGDNWFVEELPNSFLQTSQRVQRDVEWRLKAFLHDNGYTVSFRDNEFSENRMIEVSW